MELYPAVDLRDGAAVRLTQGDFARQVDYGDPLALAASFVSSGAPWLHVVDLSAARTGVSHERATLARMVELADGEVKVQTGGGIRRPEDLESVFDLGVDRVVLGTAALEDPAFATSCARRWPGRVAVGLDYVVGEDGVSRALGHGWTDGARAARPLDELLSLWAGEPVAAVVATSIARDGMLEGPDLSGLGHLLEWTALPVVASGGVASLDDLRTLARLPLAGVIVGKALVEGRFSVEEALAACAPSA